MINLLQKSTLLLLLFVQPTLVHALNANFTLKGEIVKSACTLETEKIDVPLGEVDRSVLISKHHSDPVDFSIRLTDCDPELKQSVLLYFSAEMDPNNPNKIKPTGKTTAKNIAIAVKYEGNYIQINESIPLKLDNIVTSTDVKIPFTAQLETIGDKPVTTGDVEGFLNFTVEYE